MAGRRVEPKAGTPGWVRGMFPRNRSLAELAGCILSTVNSSGYIPVWGWSRRIGASGCTKSALSSTISALVRHGYLEKRLARLGPSGRPVNVYVRSDGFLRRLDQAANDLGVYQAKHRWWTASGPLTIPNRVPRSVRKMPNGAPGRQSADRARVGGAVSRTIAFRKGAGPTPDSSDFREPVGRGMQTENIGDQVFALLARRNNSTVEAVKEMCRKMIEEKGLEMTEVEVARMFLAECGRP